MNARLWISRILLAFVFVTIGFALGRETAPQAPSVVGLAGQASGTEQAETDDRLAVYSVHMTFRCWECNQIEWLTKELLEEEFAEHLESGRIEYWSVDYMRDADFARRYNIAASTLVLVRFEDGEEAAFERLDEVWTKARNRDEFMAYVRSAIETQLEHLERSAA